MCGWVGPCYARENIFSIPRFHLQHIYIYIHRLNAPTPVNSSNGRETKLHPLSRWDVIIEDLSSEEDDVASEEWALI